MSIRKVSIQQIKAARALIGWSQDDLAAASGVSIPTVKRLEAVDGPIGGREKTARRLIDALEVGGIAFLDDEGIGAGPGVRLSRDVLAHTTG